MMNAVVDDETELAGWFACGSGPDSKRRLDELRLRGTPGQFMIHDQGAEPGLITLTLLGQNGTLEHHPIYVDRGCGLEPGAQRWPTLTLMVEAASAQPLGTLSTALDPAAPFQSVFSTALSRRTTSRRRKKKRFDSLGEIVAGVSGGDEADGIIGTENDGVAASTPDTRPRKRPSLDLSHLGKVTIATLGGGVVDSSTQNARWFLSGKRRDDVRAILVAMMAEARVGEFIIRDKRTVDGVQPGEFTLAGPPPQAYALNVKQSDTVLLSYLLEVKRSKCFLRGADSETFDTIADLVAFYTAEMRESLGIQLTPPGPSAGFLDKTAAGDLISPAKLPRWLQVDAELKRDVPAALRQRTGDEPTYDLGSHAGPADGGDCGSEATYELAAPREEEQMYALAAQGPLHDESAYALAAPAPASEEPNEPAYTLAAHGAASEEPDGGAEGDYDAGTLCGATVSYDMANNRSTTVSYAEPEPRRGSEASCTYEEAYSVATAPDGIRTIAEVEEPAPPRTTSKRSKRSFWGSLFSRRSKKTISGSGKMQRQGQNLWCDQPLRITRKNEASSL